MNEKQQKPLSKYAAKKLQRVSLWNDEFSKKKANPKPYKSRPKLFQQKPASPAPSLTLKEALVAIGYEDGVMKWPCCDPKIEGKYLTYRICQLNEVGHEVWKKASIELDVLKSQLEKKLQKDKASEPQRNGNQATHCRVEEANVLDSRMAEERDR